MKLPKLTVAYPDTDDITVATVTPRTEVLWERHFGVPYMSFTIPMMTRFEQTGNMLDALQQIETDHLYYLAYVAVTKGEGIEYEDWLDTIAAVVMGDPDAEPVEDTEDDAGPLGRSPVPGE